MNRQPFQTPPRWWSPKLSRFWVQFWRPVRHRRQRNKLRLADIEVRGLEHVRPLSAETHGMLITPNHACHDDAFVLYEAADRLDRLFYFMTAWQVFGTANMVERLVLRQHGCFSVDREGTDLRAFRLAVELLTTSPHPLVIFPEGVVYHLNDRVTPFREGPATIALSAAKRAKRRIACVPCAIKYHYVANPTNELVTVMNALERELFWRPRPQLPLVDRIYRYAEGLLAIKELEYLGSTSSGPLTQRLPALAEYILGGLEQRYGGDERQASIPERVKVLRQQAIKKLEELPEGDLRRRQIEDDLDDVYLVVQLFSYPGDYISERPTIERIAETVIKFAGDVQELPATTVFGVRRAVVCFGEPVIVTAGDRKKGAGAELTRTLEQRVQALLDGIEPPPGRTFGHVERASDSALL